MQCWSGYGAGTRTMAAVEAQHIAAFTAAAVQLAMGGRLTVNSPQGGAMDQAHATYRHGVSLSGDTADSGSGRVSGVQARTAGQVSQAFGKKPGRFAVRNARKIDARGIQENFWLISEDGVIAAAGTRSGDFEAALRKFSAEIQMGPIPVWLLLMPQEVRLPPDI